MLYIMNRIYYNYLIIRKRNVIIKEIFGKLYEIKKHKKLYITTNDHHTLSFWNILKLVEKKIKFIKSFNYNLIPTNLLKKFSQVYLIKFPTIILKKKVLIFISLLHQFL